MTTAIKARFRQFFCWTKTDQAKMKHLILDLSIPSNYSKTYDSVVINSFHSAGVFLYPLKDIFRGYEKSPVT